MRPSVGVGVDLSPQMVELATRTHPNMRFYSSPIETFELPGETFDYVILSDLVGFLYDIRMVFNRLNLFCHSHTRIVINWYSRVWEPIFSAAQALGLKYPQPILNWTATSDIVNFLRLTGSEPGHIEVMPSAPTRSSDKLASANRFLAHIPLIRAFNISNFIVARPVGRFASTEPTVTVVCPCRNEAGNVEEIARRLPEMGSHTELIFVEGNSKDNTLNECHRVKEAYPKIDIKVFKQTGKGKR